MIKDYKNLLTKEQQKRHEEFIKIVTTGKIMLIIGSLEYKELEKYLDEEYK